MKYLYNISYITSLISAHTHTARYTLTISLPLAAIHSVKKIQSVSLKDVGVKLPEGILVLCRNLHSMKLHIHPHNTYDADGLKELMERHFLVKQVGSTKCFIVSSMENSPRDFSYLKR